MLHKKTFLKKWLFLVPSWGFHIFQHVSQIPKPKLMARYSSKHSLDLYLPKSLGPSGNSHNSLNSDNSDNTYNSDFTSEVSTLSCPLCPNSCNTYEEGVVHVKQCEQTVADQNINLNNAEQADVDGDEDMDIKKEKLNYPFNQILFRPKNKVEQHFIIH